MDRLSNDMYRDYFKNSRGNIKREVPDSRQNIDLSKVEILDDAAMAAFAIDDVDQLLISISDLIYRAWGADNIKIIDEYPTESDPKNLQLPMIVYDYYDRTYLKNASGKPVVKSAPTQMRSVKYKEEVYDVYIELFTSKLQFDFIDKKNTDVKALTKKFEIFLTIYNGYFKYLGIRNLLFNIQPKADPYRLGSTELPRRRLIYTVEFERQYVKRQGETLQTIELVLNQNNNNIPIHLPGIYNLNEVELTRRLEDANK